MRERYVILKHRISSSPIWFHEPSVFKLFLTMVINADKDGMLYGNKIGYFHQACLGREEGEMALRILMSTDSAFNEDGCDFNGCRIKKIVNGFQIIDPRMDEIYPDISKTSLSNRKRKALKTTLRFRIFKRDGFTCQYCGSKAPDVSLEVDHIIPVSNGGSDDESNLTTACFDCNRGKSDSDLVDGEIDD